MLKGRKEQKGETQARQKKNKNIYVKYVNLFLCLYCGYIGKISV